MLDTLRSIDQDFFFFLNGLHSPLLDWIMFLGTNTVTWIPLYFLLLYLVIRQYRWKAVWVVVIAVLMIILSDQASNLIKVWISRPRPTHEPGLVGIHTVNGYLGGQFGFYSAHASNNMAIAVYLVILLGRPFRYIPLLLFSFAVFMSYTRIYLGVHYPGDILAGWAAGALIGWGFGQICGWAVRKPEIAV